MRISGGCYAAFFVFISVAISGCSGSDAISGRQPITGTVTLDGQPLDQGLITFEPQGSKTVNASAAIQNGKYEIAADSGLTAGTYRVAIRASQSSAKATDDPTEMMNQAATAKVTERIPPRYNAKSELEAEVTESGAQTFDFDLKSK